MINANREKKKKTIKKKELFWQVGYYPRFAPIGVVTSNEGGLEENAYSGILSSQSLDPPRQAPLQLSFMPIIVI